MANAVTQERARLVSSLLSSLHGHQNYFRRIEVTPQEAGYGVDLWVEGETWRQRSSPRSMPPVLYRVPICIIVVG